MATTEYTVLIIQYEQNNQKTVEDLVKSVTESIDPKHGRARRAYQGSEKRIVSAVQKIL
ncbi:MAG TPA: hypothetical protein VK487_11750 [Candidatus Bathyarchaeia archaeon]|nr:hypothetical protein [Candidatus Bathyarchaeia archaeon]